jgi:hypothetical protein
MTNLRASANTDASTVFCKNILTVKKLSSSIGMNTKPEKNVNRLKGNYCGSTEDIERDLRSSGFSNMKRFGGSQLKNSVEKLDFALKTRLNDKKQDRNRLMSLRNSLAVENSKSSFFADD